LRFGLAVEFGRSWRCRLALKHRLPFTNELLADTHDLPFAQTNRLSNVPIPPTTLRMVRIRHQQNARPSNLRCSHRLPTTESLQFRPKLR
jgi:hypothetical protein